MADVSTLTTGGGTAPTPIVDVGAEDTQLTQYVAKFLGILAGDDYKPAKPEGQLGAGPPENYATTVIDDTIAKSAEAFGGDTIYSGKFAHDLLAAINMPVTFENLRAISAWMRAETGSQGKGTPAYNPLATTQNFGKHTQFNKVGVKNYADYNTGLMATANVLHNGKYDEILDALSRGNDATAVAHAIERSPWGTGGGVLRVLGAK